jgi:hypothetical protein
MKRLIDRLGISVEHLKCLEEVFIENNEEYARIEELLNSEDFINFYSEISRELYAGGKQPLGNFKLSRQMILGDVIEYIFTGRAFYYAAKSEENFSMFLKLILYSVNQILLFDTITVRPEIRKLYIEKLEEKIDNDILYEKPGDSEIANQLKNSNVLIWTEDWTPQIDAFVDSILPKTLGCPKELIVFAELIRLKKGNVIPLLLIQRIFGEKDPIAPPDFLIAKGNKEIFGIEVGYEKEGQSREFSIRTSIPTFAVDLKNNMHNRCPKCGENILYCDVVIENYAMGTLEHFLAIRKNKDRLICNGCPEFNSGDCKFSNYYGKVDGVNFNGKPLESKKERHYHTCCVKDETYTFNKNSVNIFEKHENDFFAQIPEIDGLDNL